MTQEPMARDTRLGAALRDVAGDASRTEGAWRDLHDAVATRAASELARRRRQRRFRFVVPASLAAGLAVFVLSRPPLPLDDTGRSDRPAGVERVSIDELLDDDLSDGQVRALLSGASEADDLLLIAAGDSRP